MEELFGSDDPEDMIIGNELEINVSKSSRFPANWVPNECSVIKLPLSALCVESATKSSNSANTIRFRDNTSNARLVEWEDNSWTLIVGREHFRVFQREEQVEIFDKQSEIFISVGSLNKLMNVIPGSLDSRTHQRVVEQTTVSRKLIQSRKVFLSTNESNPASPTTVKSTSAPPPRLTQDFLEAGLSSVKDLKAQFKRKEQSSSAKRVRQSRDDDDDDDDDEDDDSESSSSSSDSDSS